LEVLFFFGRTTSANAERDEMSESSASLAMLAFSDENE